MTAHTRTNRPSHDGIRPGGISYHVYGALAGALLLIASSGCVPMSFLITPVPTNRSLREIEVSRDGVWASKKIAIIDVSGIIRNARTASLLGPEGDNPLVVFAEKLDKAAGDDHVRAVVLRINSPGGGVTASAMMYDELRRFREKTGKPIISYMMDVAASGGYYIACATDRIIAHPTTITGSIGVIMMTPDLSGTMQKIGLRANVIKSGPLKDAGSPFRGMGAQERAVFQAMIDKMYERFLAVVVTSRTNIPPGRVRELADGRVYIGEEAHENGLVDQLGTLRDAIAAAKKAAGLGDTKIVVVEYAPRFSHRPNIYAAAPRAPSQVNLLNIALPDFLKDPAPRLLYLWAPGW